MINIEKLLKSKHVEVRTINTSDVTSTFVKKFREEQNFSQTAMANMLGVTKKCIEKWEQGANNINGSSKVLLKLLYDNPELIQKVYSVREYKAGENPVEFKTIAHSELTYDEPIYYVQSQNHDLFTTPIGGLI